MTSCRAAVAIHSIPNSPTCSDLDGGTIGPNPFLYGDRSRLSCTTIPESFLYPIRHPRVGIWDVGRLDDVGFLDVTRPSHPSTRPLCYLGVS